jgi:large subunit ribosomal protein L30
MAKKTETKTVRITLVKSPIGYPEPQKRTVKALGLRRVNHTIEHDDSPVVRGMLKKIIHLIRIDE